MFFACVPESVDGRLESEEGCEKRAKMAENGLKSGHVGLHSWCGLTDVAVQMTGGVERGQDSTRGREV
jgi:hypothetical protein